MSNIYKPFYILCFVSIFFPMFTLYISNIKLSFSMLFILMLYIFLLFNFNKIKIFVLRIYKMPIIKYYIIFCLFMLLTLIINIFLGLYKAPTMFYVTRIHRLLISLFLIYLIPLISHLVGFKTQKIIKIFYTMLFIIFVSSIIQYISFVFNINFIQNIFNLLTNSRLTLYENIESCALQNRVFCFFNEPSALGQFIFIMMPFVFMLPKIKSKVFKNKIVDSIIKKTIVPLMCLTIIFTKSPIYLILCFVEFLILLFITYIKYVKKYFLHILAIIIFLMGMIYVLWVTNQSFIMQTYLYRIINTIHSLGDFNQLVIVEPSLATRIVSYSIQYVAFTKKWLIGCGLCNAESFVNAFYVKEALLSLTPENIINGYLAKTNITLLNRSAVWTTLAEMGIIGFSLYCIFFIKNFIFLTNIKQLFNKINKVFLISLSQSYICIALLSFYNISLDNQFVWLLYGFTLLYLYIVYYDYKSYE